MAGEIEIIRGLQSLFVGPIGTAFVGFCARWLVFAFVPLAAATSWKKRSRSMRHAAYEAAWAGLLALTIAILLGSAIGRPRPFNASSEVHLLVPPPLSTYSMPSAHTAVSFAVAAALAYGEVSLGLVAFSIAFFVAFGRVASGVHYPSDVFVGALVGLFAFWLVRYIHAAIRSRDISHPRHLQAGGPPKI